MSLRGVSYAKQSFNIPVPDEDSPLKPYIQKISHTIQSSLDAGHATFVFWCERYFHLLLVLIRLHSKDGNTLSAAAVLVYLVGTLRQKLDASIDRLESALGRKLRIHKGTYRKYLMTISHDDLISLKPICTIFAFWSKLPSFFEQQRRAPQQQQQHRHPITPVCFIHLPVLI